MFKDVYPSIELMLQSPRDLDKYNQSYKKINYLYDGKKSRRLHNFTE